MSEEEKSDVKEPMVREATEEEIRIAYRISKLGEFWEMVGTRADKNKAEEIAQDIRRALDKYSGKVSVSDVLLALKTVELETIVMAIDSLKDNPIVQALIDSIKREIESELKAG